MHPDYLAQMLTARQLSEWGAYDAIQPFGDVRADLRAGLIIANLLSPHVKPDAKLSPLDFMPFVKKSPAAETPVDVGQSLLHSVRSTFKTVKKVRKRGKVCR